MTFAQAFIDASYDKDPKHPLCCGGYVFLADQAVALDQVWRKEILEQYGISMFHMADCNQHDGEFKKLGRKGSDECARKAFAIIKKHAAFGFAATLMVKDYNRILRPHTDNWSAYVFCLFECLSLIKNWCNRIGFEGEIAYMFEAGDSDQSNANRLMNQILKEPRNKQRYRVLNFGFGQKIDHTPLQAADVIAWQWFKNYKRSLRRQKPRGDIVALLNPQDMTVHFDRAMLISFKLEHAAGQGLGYALESIPKAKR